MNQAITLTQAWLQNVVIAHTICPFAKYEFDNDRIHYQLMCSDVSSSLETLIEECKRLDEQKEIATSLLVYPESLEDFDDFLDYHAIAEQLLIEQGYEGIYQLASFHPNYCFDESDALDPANYTNRSPYPMLHILRESSLEKALQHYDKPEGIPERNIRYMRELGLDAVKNLSTQTK